MEGKFKVGDRVRIKDGVEYNVSLPVPTNDLSGLIGTIHRESDVDGGIRRHTIYIIFDDKRYNSASTGNYCNRIFCKAEIEHARLPYTKITEKLYKNKIEKIEDNWIYLK